MKIRILAASVALAGVSIAWAAMDEPIKPIPAAKVTDPALVELGKKLFFDPRLSKSGFISCNSCHNLSMGGTDNLKTSIGHNWNQGPINSPTVLNASLNVAQFWDGRAPSVEEQAKGPVLNPVEMGAPSAEFVVKVLKSIPGYVEGFKAAFPGEADPITYDNFGSGNASNCVASNGATMISTGLTDSFNSCSASARSLRRW